MALITLKEYAERLGKNPITVRQKAIRGGFETARHLGRDWVIDENEPYGDKRVKSGKYREWRKKYSNRVLDPKTDVAPLPEQPEQDEQEEQ